jgi:hypothetical protein
MLPRDLVYCPVCGFGVGTVTQQFVSFSIKKDTYFKKKKKKKKKKKMVGARPCLQLRIGTTLIKIS